MPIFMDLHIVPGVNAKDVAEAHRMDVYIEKEHQCTCLTYWVDEIRGHVFCLIDAPNKESVLELHNRSHGLTPHKIIEVQPELVESFLGRITDPADAPVTDTGLPIIEDSSYRILVAFRLEDPVLLAKTIGQQEAAARLAQRHAWIREAVARFRGREALLDGHMVVASFVAADSAVSCALQTQEQWDKEQGPAGWSISIHAGEPVSAANKLFGEAVLLARAMCLSASGGEVRMSASVRELIKPDLLQRPGARVQVLSLPDEQVLNALIGALDKHYADPDFGQEELCRAIALSKSQLYRKSTALTGLSPNDLLRTYRLDRAAHMLRRQQDSVSGITYASGFSSPSYFTKCFKKQFGMLPNEYLDMAGQV